MMASTRATTAGLGALARKTAVQDVFTKKKQVFSSVSSATAKYLGSVKSGASNLGQNKVSLATGLVGGLVLAGLHSATGSANEFYDYRFKLHKSPDDLASFYGGEEFMELFCVFPFVGQIMMRSGYFDDEGNVITQGIPGTMKVSMVFSDEVNEKTGVTEWMVSDAALP